ncbi:hypothetical protein HDU93_002379 [Gonapodya sp. JEL0774]|nr:hypothetical protein HDU93_002379 [Gonapodya sp. JEL0774]
MLLNSDDNEDGTEPDITRSDTLVNIVLAPNYNQDADLEHITEWMHETHMFLDTAVEEVAPACDVGEDEEPIHDPSLPVNRIWTASTLSAYHERTERAALVLQKHFRGGRGRAEAALLRKAKIALCKKEKVASCVYTAEAGPACAAEEVCDSILSGPLLATTLSQNRAWTSSSLSLYHIHTEHAVLILQKHFRGALARIQVGEMKAERRREQEAAREIMRERAALDIQRGINLLRVILKINLNYVLTSAPICTLYIPVFRAHLARRHYSVLIRNRHWTHDALLVTHARTEHAVELLKNAYRKKRH